MKLLLPILFLVFLIGFVYSGFKSKSRPKKSEDALAKAMLEQRRIEERQRQIREWEKR
jgi:hypothetical protein